MNIIRRIPDHSFYTGRNPFRSFFGLDPFRLVDSCKLADTENQLDWRPSVDVMEQKDSFLIATELPGMREKDFQVKVEENLLTLSGEKIKENKEEDDQFSRRERIYGRFERSFRLPENVNTDKISASFIQGVLTVEIPKKAESKPKSKTISVKAA